MQLIEELSAAEAALATVTADSAEVEKRPLENMGVERSPSAFSGSQGTLAGPHPQCRLHSGGLERPLNEILVRRVLYLRSRTRHARTLFAPSVPEARALADGIALQD